MFPAPGPRFAAISDIHGNSDALRAVLADIDALGIREIVNLGDHVSGPFAPRETAEILMARPIAAIRGNHDRFTVEGPEAETSRWDRLARAELGPAQLGWLAKLPATGSLGGEVFLCHGTPLSDDMFWVERVNDDGSVTPHAPETIEAAAAGVAERLILCGHTHNPGTRRLRDGRLIVNPGSVGSPDHGREHHAPERLRRGWPEARYAVIARDGPDWRVEFRQVAYDAGRMIARAKALGAKKWARKLKAGWFAAGR